MMDTRHIESLTARGEFYLCLARAFLTPLQPEHFAAMRDALADDLAELDDLLGYGGADALADYRTAIAAIPDHAALLQRYSALFVSPPRTIQITTGTYLDGAINGGTVAAMEEAYRRCGVERGTNFHDLSDHLSVQLEFVALLYLCSAEARGSDTPLPVNPAHFLHDYVTRWLPAFVRDLAAADTPNPWLPLARLLALAVARDAEAAPLTPADARTHKAITKARHDRAIRGVTPEDLDFIAQRLREKGLATDHLAIPPDQRDEARGYSRGTPPGPRTGSRYG
uniref:Molecular chaperone TorD family protein n=1 Tax=Aromatoleum evansii TaxID=59406 RepID=A0ABZ1AJJ2_AROEV|nr:molecular chaperone TorD family protein [Aromatoleum evansii]